MLVLQKESAQTGSRPWIMSIYASGEADGGQEAYKSCEGARGTSGEVDEYEGPKKSFDIWEPPHGLASDPEVELKNAVCTQKQTASEDHRVDPDSLITAHQISPSIQAPDHP